MSTILLMIMISPIQLLALCSLQKAQLHKVNPKNNKSFSPWPSLW